MIDDVRGVACRLLCEVEANPSIHAQERIAAVIQEHALPKRDRRFLSELVLGTLRRRRTLDAVIESYSKMTLRQLEPRVLQALRLGIYQLLYLDGVPAFAAISATVSLFGRRGKKPVKAGRTVAEAAGSGGAKQRSFVNGVLRSIDRECRRVSPDKDRGGASPTKRLEVRGRKVCFFSRAVFADPQTDRVTHFAQVHNHPPFLVARWLDRYGAEECATLLEGNNEPGPLFVRNNALRQDRDALVERLRSENLRCGPGSLVNSVLIQDSASELVRTRAFRDGACSVQDETSQRIAEWFPPKLKRALDLCAAPGGKVTHLAEWGEDEIAIFACDRDATRLVRVRENVARLQLKNVNTLQFDPLVSSPWPEALPAQFDLVMLDVPCSNTGVLRRKPEARERFSAESLASLCLLQRGLLDAAVPRLAPRAAILYSTCSLEPEENEQQVEAFLGRHAEFRREQERTILPSARGGDGGFAALLRRGR